MNAGLGSIVKDAVQARHVELGNTFISVFDYSGKKQSWYDLLDQQIMFQGTELNPCVLPDVPLSLSFTVTVSSCFLSIKSTYLLTVIFSLQDQLFFITADDFVPDHLSMKSSCLMRDSMIGDSVVNDWQYKVLPCYDSSVSYVIASLVV